LRLYIKLLENQIKEWYNSSGKKEILNKF